MRREITVWAVLCILVGVIAVVYLSTALTSYDGALIMPLDDTYIHFQYARQMATGHPYAYNTGDAATSGATSLLYTPLLAFGYRLRFTGLDLAYWAVFLGVISFLLSAWVIYRSVREAGGSPLHSSLWMLTFTLNGAVIWSALSGMETLLFVFSVLLCLYAYQKDWQQRAAWAGVFAALARPEGAIVAVSLAAALAYRHWRQTRKFAPWALWPIVAVFVQPLVNLIFTGTLSAAGNQAKSELYDITAPLPDRIGRIIDHWVRMWREFFEGHAAYGDPYLPGIIFLLAIGVVLWAVKRSTTQRIIRPGLLAGAWLVGLSAAVSTLETAFWHYKRYQMPIMALAVPLAGWGMVALAQRTRYKRIVVALSGVILLFSAATNREFLPLYHNNVFVTSHFQLQVAQWVDEHVPADATLGVFDVGIIRYAGGHDTYDTVGLTTQGVAGAMRQGPGTVYDTMAAHASRPDYFVLYPIDRHPSSIYLMQTDVWGEELARFEAPDLPNTTIAGPLQVVVKADWSGVEPATQIHQPHTQRHLDSFRYIDALDVGDLDAEEDYAYTWENPAQVPGFLTTLEQLPYTNCQDAACSIIDGVRSINGHEAFDLPAIAPDDDYLIVMRVKSPNSAVHLSYGCDRSLGDLVIPALPGHWIELAFTLPGTETRLCLDTDDLYQPARYWFYAGQLQTSQTADPPLATWDGLALTGYTLTGTEDAFVLNTTWWVPPATTADLHGDGKLFIHLYTADQRDQPPLTQWDGYLDGTVPLNNLLPGTITMKASLPRDGLPPVPLTIGLGFYDPQTGQRYPIQSSTLPGDDERLFFEIANRGTKPDTPKSPKQP